LSLNLWFINIKYNQVTLRHNFQWQELFIKSTPLYARIISSLTKSCLSIKSCNVRIQKNHSKTSYRHHKTYKWTCMLPCGAFKKYKFGMFLHIIFERWSLRVKNTNTNHLGGSLKLMAMTTGWGLGDWGPIYSQGKSLTPGCVYKIII